MKCDNCSPPYTWENELTGSKLCDPCYSKIKHEARDARIARREFNNFVNNRTPGGWLPGMPYF